MLTFVPILAYSCAVLISIVLMGLHEYHLVGTVLVDTADVSVIIGATVLVLFFIAGLFEPLSGLPRIRGWFIGLALAPLVATSIIVSILGSYTSRGVFFMPVMTEAYLGSVIFCLGFALTGSMLVPAGIGIHNFIVGKLNKPCEQRLSTTQSRRRISRGSILTLVLTYAVGITDFLLIHIFWVRVFVIALLVFGALLIPKRVVALIAGLIAKVTKRADKTSKTRSARLIGLGVTKTRSNKRLVTALIVATIIVMAFVPTNSILVIYPRPSAVQVSKGVYLIANYPAGLAYEGPPTTALAGYFCIKYINPGNDYSIQLNMKLNNGFWVQNTYGYNLINGSWGYGDAVWALLMGIHGNNTQTAGDVTCGWLVTAIRNGYIYFGYSLDGKSIVWYDKYPAFNATYIVQHRQDTNLVLAGWGWGQSANLNNALVYLAIYYWNGTNWAPAPVTVLKGYGDTGETVNHAYVYTNSTCSAVVAYPTPTTETTCPTTPGFNP